MTREIGPELIARIRHVADSLEAIARGEVDSPQPFIAADCNGEVVPLYRTPQTHATPSEGSVPESYGKPDAKRINSDMKNEPVAWAIRHKDHQYVSLLREMAEAHNVFAAPIVPLYSSPTLTDEEREAVEWATMSLDLYADEMALSVKEVVERQAILRKLLERTK